MTHGSKKKQKNEKLFYTEKKNVKIEHIKVYEMLLEYSVKHC